MASSLKVRRNVTRCGEPAFTAYEMYLNLKLSSPPLLSFFSAAEQCLNGGSHMGVGLAIEVTTNF